MEMEKSYNPKKFEDEIYQKEMESGYFSPDNLAEWINNQSEDLGYFSMVLPPPNVTGVLHMGHAAMLAIEDLLARYNRMKGKRTLWLPGTDHAAIATQTKVEKLLMEKGIINPKEELGREKFLKEVGDFAQASHDTIISQCKKMGSSLDWSREAYTLDEQRSLAVRTVFKKMYDDGLIERGYRIVNWCPRCQSTLADDEVEYVEQMAMIYTFKYDKDFPLTISTTRPETKLGDTAVAVHPDDERYQKFIGQTFHIKSFAGGPDLNIKVISDPSIDREFGTGVVGITPAHSLVDYEMATKNDLPITKIINESGVLTAEAGDQYQGLSVIEAREKVIKYLRDHNLMLAEEKINNNLSVCYRCGTAIEPLPSRQWFIKVNKEFIINNSNINGINSGEKTTLKKLMKASVAGGQIKIIPDQFEKIYFHWIDNLHDWCISRQIWYGHQIPVWYKKSDDNLESEIFVGLEAPLDQENWVQDPDTLDTWFSSGLWTFSTLGWPNQSDDLHQFHPTTVMETGYDILPFWVARMILMTTYVLGDIPFEKVYLHGLVRDEQGRKMSKSLGNVINPLDMIEEYGADATRLSLLIGCTPGNDMKLSEDKIASFRNFTNKLWNICRFSLMNIESGEQPVLVKTKADKWILTRLNQTIEMVTKNIEQFNFSFAGECLRDFTWNELADWYLEVSKIEGDKSGILKYIVENILRLWHPFMPFVTEAVWTSIYQNNLLLVEPWPKENKDYDYVDGNDFELVKEVIVAIRALRTDYKIAPAKIINVSINVGNDEKFLDNNKDVIEKLARVNLSLINNNRIKKPEEVVIVVSGKEVYLEVSSAIDKDKEIERINKEIGLVQPYLNSLTHKLNNEEFVNNAPVNVVETERKKLAEAQIKLDKLLGQLQNLK